MMMLNTITPDHRDLRSFSIHTPGISDCVGEQFVKEVEAARPGMQWPDLDRLLVEFWESRSIPSRVMVYGLSDEQVMEEQRYLLPETTKKYMTGEFAEFLY
jgi:hypothetical protein